MKKLVSTLFAEVSNRLSSWDPDLGQIIALATRKKLALFILRKLQRDNRLQRKIFSQGSKIGDIASGDNDFFATGAGQTKIGEPFV